MVWRRLFVAGLFEVGWAIGLKYTEGFTKQYLVDGSPRFIASVYSHIVGYK